MKTTSLLICLTGMLLCTGPAMGQVSEEQRARLLTRFPRLDTNKDGRLTAEELQAFRESRRGSANSQRAGVSKTFKTDPGWEADKFPDHAVSYRSPEEIAAIYAKTLKGKGEPVTSYDKPADGSLRIVGTGHSFMAPGYKTVALIARAAGLEQPPLVTHTGGGVKGSTRYKWEQENGIFQFDGKPTPKLLSSIANAQWDVMMWGPYRNDQPAYYTCWIDFCLKYNPDMKFYLADVWPQLAHIDPPPTSEDELTAEVLTRMGRKNRDVFIKAVGALNEKYPGRVHILPACDAMVIAAQHYLRGELPGVEGLHKVLGKKERSLWRDRLGHLGPGFGNLEGYIFYATLYGRSPELIKGDVPFNDKGGYPSRELDRVFRKIAWQAVINHPLTGVTDQNGNGIDDKREK